MKSKTCTNRVLLIIQTYQLGTDQSLKCSKCLPPGTSSSTSFFAYNVQYPIFISHHLEVIPQFRRLMGGTAIPGAKDGFEHWTGGDFVLSIVIYIYIYIYIYNYVAYVRK